MYKKSLAAWLLYFLALSLSGCGGVSLFAVFSSDDSQDSQPVDFLEIAASANSAISDRRLLVIRDISAWDALWEKHVANQSPIPVRPAVNFSQEMVIGIFLGQRSFGCSGVSVQSVWQRDDPPRIEVSFREFILATSAACTTGGNSPATLIVTPYSPLPVGFIQVQ